RCWRALSLSGVRKLPTLIVQHTNHDPVLRHQPFARHRPKACSSRAGRLEHAALQDVFLLLAAADEAYEPISCRRRIEVGQVRAGPWRRGWRGASGPSEGNRRSVATRLTKRCRALGAPGRPRKPRRPRRHGPTPIERTGNDTLQAARADQVPVRTSPASGSAPVLAASAATSGPCTTPGSGEAISIVTSISGSTRGSSAAAAGELCRLSGSGTKCTGASSTWC